MGKIKKGGRHYQFVLYVSLMAVVCGLAGCGSPAGPPEEEITPTPTQTQKISLAGTWERNDGRETLFIIEDGTVVSMSMALDVNSTYRNVIRCDGVLRKLSSAPENGQLSQLQVLIGPHKYIVDDNQQITVEKHQFMEQWVTDLDPCMETQMSGTGKLISTDTMEIEFLNERIGHRQTYTYTKTGS